MNSAYPEKQASRKTYLSLLWTPILLLIAAILAVLFLFVFRNLVGVAPLDNFDSMIVSNGFHTITLPDGKTFSLSYEQDHDRIFTGLVRHINMDHELTFPILSYDILITNGDFSNRDLVSTSVEDHHFTWQSSQPGQPSGSINLLHTVPMNQEIEEQLAGIKVGDQVEIDGWELLDIKAYSKEGKYLAMWKDSGCNSILVTNVIINPPQK